MSHRQTRLERSNEGSFPYWVALLAEKCSGVNYHRHRDFCAEHGLSISRFGHSVIWESQWYEIMRFAREADADRFIAEFGGERMIPQEKGLGKHWMMWKKGTYKPKKRDPYDFS